MTRAEATVNGDVRSLWHKKTSGDAGWAYLAAPWMAREAVDLVVPSTVIKGDAGTRCSMRQAVTRADKPRGPRMALLIPLG